MHEEFDDDDDDLIFGKEPSLEDLKKIEEKGDLGKTIDIDKICHDIKNESSSLIKNSGMTWCEATTHIDGGGSSEYSQLENADKLGNTASPFHLGKD